MHRNDVVTMTTVRVGGQDMLLLPERAAFLPESDTLLVADAHLGKALMPPRLGVPAAVGGMSETLAVLSLLVQRFEVRRIVFLGTFLHAPRSRAASTLSEVASWREAHPLLDLQLVRGPQDEHAVDPPWQWGIEVFDEPLMHGHLALCHQPRPVPGAYALGGHLHPCVSVGGRTHDWVRMPCFWFTPEFGVLPAFGSFTGMQTIRAGKQERVFAATPQRVFELLPNRR